MSGSIDSTNEATERLFVARLGPSEAHGEWSLRVRPLERWDEAQRAGWLGLIAECFIRLAAVGGLCGERGLPTAMAFGAEVDVWDLGGALEWHFGRLTVDPGAATLLLNLCDWAALYIAPAAVVEVLGHPLPAGPEPPTRPLPERTCLGFALEELMPNGEDLVIHVEFVRGPSADTAVQIHRLLRPWYSALLHWGFAVAALPVGASEVRPADPPLLCVGELWSFRFDRFTARREAIDVLLNCLERIHQTVSRIQVVTIE